MDSSLLRILKTVWVWVLLAAFLGVFCFSTLIYRLRSDDESYTLLFPSAKSAYQNQQFSNLYAERRKIPKPRAIPPTWTERERKVYYLVKELSYGPRIIHSYPFLPFGTKINNLAMQANDVYIDFAETFLSGKSEHYFDTNGILALTKKVLRLNFPQIENIYFTVEGQDIPRAN